MAYNNNNNNNNNYYYYYQSKLFGFTLPVTKTIMTTTTKSRTKTIPSASKTTYSDGIERKLSKRFTGRPPTHDDASTNNKHELVGPGETLHRSSF